MPSSNLPKENSSARRHAPGHNARVATPQTTEELLSRFFDSANSDSPMLIDDIHSILATHFSTGPALLSDVHVDTGSEGVGGAFILREQARARTNERQPDQADEDTPQYGAESSPSGEPADRPQIPSTDELDRMERLMLLRERDAELRRGHKYGVLKIRGNGSGIQGSVTSYRNDRFRAQRYRRHTYDDAEVDGNGSLLQGDVTETVLIRFFKEPEYFRHEGNRGGED